MSRAYTRKFDWDEARRRHAAGETIHRLAAEYGVTRLAVRRVVTPGYLERENAHRKEWMARGRCDDCGGPMNKLSRSHGSTRCKPCSDRAQLTTVNGDLAYCSTCKKWLPLDDFHANKTQRKSAGGIHGQCRPCNTEWVRKWRAANRDRYNAYQRAYRAAKGGK